MYKLTNKIIPNAFIGEMTLNNAIHQHNTRGAMLIHVSACSLQTRKQSIAIMGPRVWNNIPQEVKHVACLQTFKNEYKKVVYSQVNP